MRVLAASCPHHGVLAEWNDPGPADTPEKCWKPDPRRTPPGSRQGKFLCPPPKCGARLQFSWSEA